MSLKLMFAGLAITAAIVPAWAAQPDVSSEAAAGQSAAAPAREARDERGDLVAMRSAYPAAGSTMDTAVQRPQIILPQVKLGQLQAGQVMLITDRRIEVMNQASLAQVPLLLPKLATKIDFCMIH